MKKISTLSAIALATLALGLTGMDWTQFRGKGGSSSSSGTVLPINVGAKQNIKWQAALPGKGPSSPIVLGNRVYVTCSSGDKQDRLSVLAFESNTGKKIWQRDFWATGRCACHPLSANARRQTGPPN